MHTRWHPPRYVECSLHCETEHTHLRSMYQKLSGGEIGLTLVQFNRNLRQPWHFGIQPIREGAPFASLAINLEDIDGNPLATNRNCVIVVTSYRWLATTVEVLARLLDMFVVVHCALL